MSIASRITSIEEHIKESYQELEGIGIDTTGVNKNLENIPKLIDGYWETLPKVTGEGTSITLDNTKEGKMKIVLKGNTSQEGTPTPETPQNIHVVSGDNSIEVCGKNLAYTNWASDFVSRINDNTKAKLQTEDNRNCLFFSASAGFNEYDTQYMFKTNWKENTQYTFSFDMKSTANAGNIAIAYTDGTAQTFGSLVTANTWSKVIMTSTANKTIKYLRANWASGSSYIDLSTFMINEGTSATTYEEYKGASYPINLGDIELCKIGDYQDRFFKTSGKNLFDLKAYLTSLNVSYTENNDGSITFSPTTTVYQNPFVFSSEDTTVSLQSVITLGTITGFKIQLLNSSNVSQGQITNSSSTLANKSACKIRFDWSTSGTVTLKNTMIELGSSVTDYEPYGTDWYLNKQIGKVVLNGSESGWALYNASGTAPRRFGLYQTKWYKNSIPLLSDYFIGGEYNSQIDLSMWTQTSYLAITDKNSKWANATSLQTWLSTHNTIVYYILATPTYTEITDSTLLSQLNALAKSYASQTNISQENNDLASVLNATALEEM